MFPLRVSTPRWCLTVLPVHTTTGSRLCCRLCLSLTSGFPPKFSLHSLLASCHPIAKVATLIAQQETFVVAKRLQTSDVMTNFPYNDTDREVVMLTTHGTLTIAVRKHTTDLVAKGSLMSVNWSFCTVFGVIIARYFRHKPWWASVHKLLQGKLACFLFFVLQGSASHLIDNRAWVLFFVSLRFEFSCLETLSTVR